MFGVETDVEEVGGGSLDGVGDGGLSGVGHDDLFVCLIVVGFSIDVA